MSKQKWVMIGAVLFYLWYIYTGAVYHFAYFLTSGVLYKVLCIIALPVWIDGELAASLLGIIAPFAFLVGTVFILWIIPGFSKKQKIALTVMPIVSYALIWVMEFIYSAYFSYSATH